MSAKAAPKPSSTASRAQRQPDNSPCCTQSLVTLSPRAQWHLDPNHHRIQTMAPAAPKPQLLHPDAIPWAAPKSDHRYNYIPAPGAPRPQLPLHPEPSPCSTQTQSPGLHPDLPIAIPRTQPLWHPDSAASPTGLPRTTATQLQPSKLRRGGTLWGTGQHPSTPHLGAPAQTRRLLIRVLLQALGPFAGGFAEDQPAPPVDLPDRQRGRLPPSRAGGSPPPPCPRVPILFPRIPARSC